MVTTVSCRGARLNQLDYCLDDLCCSVAQSCPALCDPVDCSTAGRPVLHCLLQLAQTHVHWAGDAIQPSHPLLPPSPLALTLSQHQGLFQCVSSSHLKVAKVLIQMTIISTTGGKNALRNGAALIVKQNKTKQSEMKYFGETSKMTQLSQFVSKANHWLSQ